jgi:hypothetical protein
VRDTVARMKAHHGIAGLVAAAAVLAGSSDAVAAGHANGFGEKGQIILSADRLVPLFSYTYASTTTTVDNIDLTHSRSGSGISLLFGRNLAQTGDNSVPINVHTIPRVAFDVTIIPRLTLGASIAFGFGLGGTTKNDVRAGAGKNTVSSDTPTATAIGFAPRVGYILPLGEMFAFWPRAGLGFYSVSSSTDRNPDDRVPPEKDSDTLVSLDLDPQFALVPFEHFFIHAGPILNIPIAGTRSHTTTEGARRVTTDIDSSLFNFGISAGLGGWFNVF